jgi:large subunit ribosomal protein L21
VTYAIISLGGKQYRVQEGQRLLVDRLAQAESATFHPDVLLVGGDGKVEFAPKGIQVTATVKANVLGEKIRIGKYKRRTGYRRHTGHRSKLTQIEITAIGSRSSARPKVEKPEEQPEEKAAPASKPRAAAKPASRTVAAKPKPAAAAAAAKAPAKPRTRSKPKEAE